MLLTVQAGPYALRGVSLGGVYTSIQVPQLGVLLDAGMAARSGAGLGHILITHGHADHVGALGAILGIRGLGRLPPPRVLVPAAIASEIATAVGALSRLQREAMDVEVVPLAAGDEVELRPDLRVRALEVEHVVPTVAYQFFNRVKKLRPEHRTLPGSEIGRRRLAGENLFDEEERLEFAYVTDTHPGVLERHPSLLETRVLVMECTFLDERKPVEVARRSGHTHLDDLLEFASRFRNEALVLMHFSQLYSPAEVHAILRRRWPTELGERLVPFAPPRGDWPG